MFDSKLSATGTPLVSIVVPTLNRAQYLKPTIDSILQQEYPNIECIVVDGGSADGTLEILKGYGDRIKWLSEPDNGHADAINKGWKMSRGQILAWLNADDCYVVPDAVDRAVNYFHAHPDVDLVYGNYGVISEDGRLLYDVVRPRKWDLTYAVKYCFYIIPQPASFIRRPILEKVGWLDPEFQNGKDHELWLRIGLVGKIEYTPVLFAYVRCCPGISQHLTMCEAKVRINQKFFKNKNLPPPFNSRKFQRRALSNAFLTGGEYALDGGCLTKALNYFTKALITDPLNLFYIISRASARISRRILSAVLPHRWKRKLVKMVFFPAGEM